MNDKMLSVSCVTRCSRIHFGTQEIFPGSERKIKTILARQMNTIGENFKTLSNLLVLGVEQNVVTIIWIYEICRN